MAIAVAAPFIAEIPLGLRVPTVVIELVLGIIAGPHGLGLVRNLDADQPVALLGAAGLGFLFFLVGMEIDVGRFRGRPLSLAAISWCSSLAIAIAAMALLSLAGYFREPAMIAVAMTTTSTGMLAPIMRDTGKLETRFGNLFLAAATLGEFGPILVVALMFTRVHSYPAQAALMLSFVMIALAMALAAMRVHPLRIMRLFHRTLHMSSQLPVRICMFVLTFLMVLAGAVGIDAILGAFAAGMVIGPSLRGKDGHLVREKLDAIAFGYFVPFFFVVSGMRLDIAALSHSVAAILLAPMFLALFLIVRGAPVYFYRKDLAAVERLPFALYLSTALPLVVAITDIGVQTRNMRNESASGLVAAAILSSLIFPTVADYLMRRASRKADEHSAAPVTQMVHRH